MSYGEGGICRIQYRPLGPRDADMHTRIVRCQLAVGHEGDHEETDTGSTWPQGIADLVGIASDFTGNRSTAEHLIAGWCKRYEDCETLRDKMLALCYWDDGHEEREEIPVEEVLEVLLGRWTQEELDTAKERARVRTGQLRPLIGGAS